MRVPLVYLCLARLTCRSLLCLCVFLAPLSGAATDPVDACELFRHPEQYYGRTIQIRGVFVHHTEGTTLYGYPKCEGIEFPLAEIRGGTAETVAAWRKGGGFKGAWMLSNMTGRFERNASGGYLFRIESLTVLRRVKPYVIPQ